MKCSVCAQEIPEESYSEHLAAEHGVTDDPSAVLFEHLTGDRLDEGPGDGSDEEALVEEDDGEPEDEDVESAPAPSEDELEDDDSATEGDLGDDEADVEEEDEEQELQDPFERMLAEHPTTDAQELAAWRAANRAKEGEDEDGPADTHDDGGAEDDQAEEVDPLDALVAAYPSWDVRAGADDVGTVVLPEREERGRGWRRRRAEAPASADVGAAPEPEPEPEEEREEPETERVPVVAPVAVVHDEDDAPVVAPVATEVAEPGTEMEAPPVAARPAADWQRQRRVAMAGLVAVVILIAAAVTYLLTRDS
ncbi:MAG: hypothetical protein JWP02_2363, partial [Acidimicrobiales bacterium]|nr:hypothetical protein [Acidimicrobiales bacterium]